MSAKYYQILPHNFQREIISQFSKLLISFKIIIFPPINQISAHIIDFYWFAAN